MAFLAGLIGGLTCFAVGIGWAMRRRRRPYTDALIP